MTCRACRSHQQEEFQAEINIHPPGGLENLNKPCVLAFPKLTICYDCGFAEFVLDGIERNELHDYRTDGKHIVTICASCKRIHQESGSWSTLDDHVRHKRGALFSHGICPDCAATVYPDSHFGP